MTTTNLNDNVLPLTPNPGTADPDPLVTFVQYQKATGDQVSGVEDVEAALLDAISDLSRECRRTIAYGQYTETQFIYPNGMVWPSATPLDPNQPITSGDINLYDPTTDGGSGSSVIQGDGVWVGFYAPLPSMPIFSGVMPPQTVVTYSGGYRQATIPPKLRRMICKVAAYTLNPYLLLGQPMGVKSMSVNGVSISGDLSSMMETDSDLRKAVIRFRHPQIRAWQS